MGLRFQEQEFGKCFFVTTTFKDWNEYGKVEGMYSAIAKSLTFCSNKFDSKIVAYVLMPSHIHLLLFIDGDKISDFMRDLKKFISQKAAKDLKIKYSSVWMPRFDRVDIQSESIFRTKLDYIHNNPVNRNMVKNPEEWYWSSAGDYADGKSGDIKIWKEWM